MHPSRKLVGHQMRWRRSWTLQERFWAECWTPTVAAWRKDCPEAVAEPVSQQKAEERPLLERMVELPVQEVQTGPAAARRMVVAVLQKAEAAEPVRESVQQTAWAPEPVRQMVAQARERQMVRERERRREWEVEHQMAVRRKAAAAEQVLELVRQRAWAQGPEWQKAVVPAPEH